MSDTHCTKCGKKLSMLNKAHGVAEPLCSTCYRKKADVSNIFADNVKKTPGGVNITLGCVFIGLAILGFMVGAIREAWGLLIGAPIILVIGIGLLRLGLKSRKTEPPEE